MRLSENFTLEELSKTNTGLANVPDSNAVRNLVRLAICILQPLRDAYGKPIYVNSGYRSQAVNQKVKGVKNSQHLLGEAADITASHVEPSATKTKTKTKTSADENENEDTGLSLSLSLSLSQKNGLSDSDYDYRAENKRLFDLIQSLELPFDQLIDERNYQWIHVSFSTRRRRQVLHLG